MMDADERNVSGCGLTGMMNKKGAKVDGQVITRSMCNMRERGNGLGAGFAAYGTYPDRKDCFALHLMYDHKDAKEVTEEYLKGQFDLSSEEPIPTRESALVVDPPIFWRYFVYPRESLLALEEGSQEDYILNRVMKINTRIEGAFVVVKARAARTCCKKA